MFIHWLGVQRKTYIFKCNSDSVATFWFTKLRIVECLGGKCFQGRMWHVLFFFCRSSPQFHLSKPPPLAIPASYLKRSPSPTGLLNVRDHLGVPQNLSRPSSRESPMNLPPHAAVARLSPSQVICTFSWQDNGILYSLNPRCIIYINIWATIYTGNA